MNKNAKAFNTLKTESSSNSFKPVNLKTILKLEGKRDHCKIIFFRKSTKQKFKS